MLSLNNFSLGTLLVGTDDGVVCVWKNAQENEQLQVHDAATVSVAYCISGLLYQWLTVSLAYCITGLLYQWLTVSVAYCISGLLYHWLTLSLAYSITGLLYHWLIPLLAPKGGVGV